MPPGGKAVAYFIVQLTGNTSLLSAGSLPSMQTNSYSISTISTTAIVHTVTNKATKYQPYPLQPSCRLSTTNTYKISTIYTTTIVHTVNNKQLQNMDDIHNNDRPHCHQQTDTCQRYPQQPSTVNDFTNH